MGEKKEGKIKEEEEQLMEGTKKAEEGNDKRKVGRK